MLAKRKFKTTTMPKQQDFESFTAETQGPRGISS